MNNNDFGPAIGFVLIALVAFLILISVGTNGRFYDLAVNEMHKSFGSPTEPARESPSRIDELKTWTENALSGVGTNVKKGDYSCVSYKNPEYAELLYVVDGDTIAVRLSDGSVNRVRYIGVNTAEEGEKYYQTGKDKNAELVSSNNGILTMYKDKSDKDNYGRLLRYVFSGDVFVNYELVSSGVAEAMTINPDTSCSALFEKSDHYIGN